MPAEVDILLATYNGEKYLDTQLESIFEQEFSDFRILVRDDGSTDQTPQIISKWQNLFPQKIEILTDGLGNVGPTMNFQALMEHATAPYICFCDQDDKWMSKKLSQQLQLLRSLEEKNPGLGIMIFSDLILCDENLNVLSPSLIEKERLNTEAISTNQLLMQNVPYGCASMINRKLLKKALPIDKRALLHDHWIALVASLTGVLVYEDEVLIYHRLHKSNASREGSEHKKLVKNHLKSKINNQNFHTYLFKQIAQAQAILENYENNLNVHQIKLLNSFIALQHTRGFKRKWIIVKNKFYKNSLKNTLKLILRA